MSNDSEKKSDPYAFSVIEVVILACAITVASLALFSAFRVVLSVYLNS